MANLTAEQWVKDPGRVVLRGKLWTVTNVTWHGADRSAGILSDYVDEFDLEDADGNLWNWDTDQLTDEEDKAVNECLSGLVREYDDYE